jgi:4-hydroxy-3-polyprenylbenzoate decarboxylase
MALGISDLEDIGANILKLVRELTSPKESIKDKLLLLPRLNQLSSWMPRTQPGRGKCQEVVLETPDLNIFPILKCWPEDGGRFITLPLVHTKDPITGIRNVGMYRMQVLDKNTTGMHWHMHKVGARHYREYKSAGKKIPIAVALGGDPVYTYVATAPLPDNMDEYMFAGFLRKQRVDLVKCLTQDIEVPYDADIVIEGYVNPEEDLFSEGPFGDHTGYYSLADWYPKFHVTCITHRKNAVYPATIVGIPPQEDAYIAKATERIFLVPLQLSVIPELIDIELPFAGVAHNLTIVKIKKEYPGQARKVMNALWGAGQMMLNKVLIVVDESLDIHDYKILITNVLNNFSPLSDICFSKGPLDVLDHASSKLGFGGKIGIDATKKLPEEDEFHDHINDEQKSFKFNIDRDGFPEIVAVNNQLSMQGLPLVIVAVKKQNSAQLRKLASRLISLRDFIWIKVLFFVDIEVDIYDLAAVTWLIANNIDPQRDCWVVDDQENKTYSHLFIDGTRKTKGKDDFERDWPNIIVSNDDTITLVDQMWPSLGLDKLIKSPSIKYKPLVKDGGAEVKH